MKKDLISVIVPVFNVQEYLDKCLRSIIKQTYRNIEIILVDDGSTDSSGLICDKYREIDSRIVVIHKSNGGLSSARNKGLDIAKGEYVCFVDSDDYLENEMYEELIKNMKNNKSDISVCNYYREKNNKRIVANTIGPDNSFIFEGKEKFNNIQNEYTSLTVYAWNKLYKKEIFNDIRFPDGKIYEYSYILCDILNNARKVSYTFKPLYNYVYRKSSIGNSFNINHFNKIDSNNKKIEFFTKKGYFDLAYREKQRKLENIIISLTKMKRYRVKNNEIYRKYYQELVNINKEVKWKDADKINKFYKIFRRLSISFLAFGLRIRDLKK